MIFTVQKKKKRFTEDLFSENKLVLLPSMQLIWFGPIGVLYKVKKKTTTGKSKPMI